MIWLGRYNTDVYWNPNNQMIWSAFTANKYSWFEHRSTCCHYCGNIVSVSKKSGGFPKRTVFLKDGLVKYDVSAG